jgi:hypothetical protein
MPKMCGKEGCNTSLEGRGNSAKWCEPCAKELHRLRKEKRNARVRAAYAASTPPEPVERPCQFPGCTTLITVGHWNKRWCLECRQRMLSDRAMRRVGQAARVTSMRDKQQRKALWANQRRVPQPNSGDMAHPREKVQTCLECFNQSWARVTDRANERSGNSAAGGPPVAWPAGLGVPGCAVPVCRGCGLAWAEEPRPELCGTIRSSSAMAEDHGSMFGGEPTRNSYAQPTGKRKGAK